MDIIIIDFDGLLFWVRFGWVGMCVLIVNSEVCDIVSEVLMFGKCGFMVFYCGGGVVSKIG